MNFDDDVFGPGFKNSGSEGLCSGCPQWSHAKCVRKDLFDSQEQNGQVSCSSVVWLRLVLTVCFWWIYGLQPV